MWQQLNSIPSRPTKRDVTITDVGVMGLVGNPKTQSENYTWGIVKIETNTGHVGIGETFRGVLPLRPVEIMSETVLGENPLDPPRIAERLNREHYTASGGIGRAAIAAIEMACWDVKGKLLDLPVYELLGGKYRDKISLYSDAEALAGDSNVIDFDMEYTPSSYATTASEVVDAGFKALKFDLDVPTPESDEDRASRRLDNSGINHKVELVQAVRDEIGYEIDLGMDLHWSYSAETAMRLGKKLERFDLAFLEDPVHPEKQLAQSRVANALDTPVLTGENLTSAAQFNDLLRQDAIDIAAPDVAMCGGLSEVIKIANLCDVYAVPIAPHNLGSPIATVAGVHIGASVQNFHSIEYRGGDSHWWPEIVQWTAPGKRNKSIIEDGKIHVPEGPGLGIEFTEKAQDYVTEDSEWIF